MENSTNLKKLDNKLSNKKTSRAAKVISFEKWKNWFELELDNVSTALKDYNKRVK